MSRTRTFQDFQDFIIKANKGVISETGSITGMVFIEKMNKQGELEPIMLALDGDLLKDRERLYKKILPNALKKVVSKDKVLHMAWCSEAWMRILDTKTGNETKKEVVFHHFLSKDKEVSIYTEMLNKGSKVDSRGKLIRDIELAEPIKQEGEISGPLYSCLKKYF